MRCVRIYSIYICTHIHTHTRYTQIPAGGGSLTGFPLWEFSEVAASPTERMKWSARFFLEDSTVDSTVEHLNGWKSKGGEFGKKKDVFRTSISDFGVFRVSQVLVSKVGIFSISKKVWHVNHVQVWQWLVDFSLVSTETDSWLPTIAAEVRTGFSQLGWKKRAQWKAGIIEYALSRNELSSLFIASCFLKGNQVGWPWTIFNFFQYRGSFSLDLSTKSLVQVNVTRLVPVNPAPSWILSATFLTSTTAWRSWGKNHDIWERCVFFLRWRESSTSSKECHCRGEIRFICYLLAFDASPWFGKAFRTSFPLDKIWHILALWQTQFLSKSCEEVIPNSTCPSPSSTDWMFHIALGEFKSGDGCSCDLKLLYHRGWWYNHSSKDRFLNLSVSIILGFASPKKSGRMCRLPLAHYTKQWNCLFLLCLLGFFTQSSPSHDAVLWFHFVGRLSYPIRKKPVEMTEVRMERCFAMPALAMVEVLHTLNGPPGYFSKWIPMDSSEFAWGLQPWSGMGTVPGEALWVFFFVEIFDV